jgi:hypothetical protein
MNTVTTCLAALVCLLPILGAVWGAWQLHRGLGLPQRAKAA